MNKEQEPPLQQTPRGSTPVPDPTVLTTQQLVREIAASREIIESRLDAMDTATKINREASDKVPGMISQVVDSLKAVHDEKFASIQTQFKERDTRTEQTQKDSKVAVDAALQAAKEAVGEQNKSNALANAKMEAAFTKQVDAIGVQITQNAKANDDKVDDLKQRITTLESSINTRQESIHDDSAKNSWMIPMLAQGILTLIAIAIALYAAFRPS